MIRNCTLAFICLMALMSVNAQAQTKIAYINMQELISSMPEAKKAYDSLQLYEQALSKDGQALLADFQQKVKQFNDGKGKMTPGIEEVKTKELETARANIEQYKERMDQQIALKEQQLTTPIVIKARKAVSAIAAEKGYVVVLDNSKDIVVTATCDDILAAAKLKLGIK